MNFDDGGIFPNWLVRTTILLLIVALSFGITSLMNDLFPIEEARATFSLIFGYR